MRGHRLAAIVGLCAAMWLNACGDGATDLTPPDPPRATTLTVTPATVELSALGTTVQLTAEVRDQNGQAMAGAAVSWATSDADVATVSASALVTAAGNGSATITATSGAASGSTSVTVLQVAALVTITPDSIDTRLLPGDTLRLTAEAADANGHAIAAASFAWSSSDTLVADVDSMGLVTATGRGEATVTAMQDGVGGRAAIVVEPAVTVAFVADSMRLAEGETRTVGIRYQVVELAEPWSLGVSFRPGTASLADYEVETDRVQIPAGRSLSGEIAFDLTAYSDKLISEGDETLTAKFVADGNERRWAELGDDMEITILEAGASPCPGVRVFASPVAAYPDGVWDGGGPHGSGRRGGLQTTMVTDWSDDSDEVVFDWIAPYAPFAFIPGGATVSITDEFSYQIYSIFHARIPEWQVETVGGATRHRMLVQWPTDLTAAIRFRSGSCVQQPVVACDGGGCRLKDSQADSDLSRRDTGPTPSPIHEPTSLRVESPDIARTGVSPAVKLASALPMHREADPGIGNVDDYLFRAEGIGDSQTAIRWSDAVWGMSDTLVWEVLTDESDYGANDYVNSPEKALAFVESALRAWSEIPSARILWRAELAPKEGGGCVKDGRNTLTMGLGVGGACVRAERSEAGRWEIVECDTFLAPGPEWAWINLTHEFGHCMGLEHSPVPPLYRFRDESPALAGQIDPVMSYGRVYVDLLPALTADDRIGASLLRPDPEWRAASGSVSGTLLVEDETVPHGVVWAVRVNEDEAPRTVSTVSDEHGTFRLEGLTPGATYILWAGSLVVERANQSLVRGFFDGRERGAFTDLEHTVLPRPVRVVAGQEAGGLAIRMRRREGHPP